MYATDADGYKWYVAAVGQRMHVSVRLNWRKHKARLRAVALTKKLEESWIM